MHARSLIHIYLHCIRTSHYFLPLSLSVHSCIVCVRGCSFFLPGFHFTIWNLSVAFSLCLHITSRMILCTSAMWRKATIITFLRYQHECTNIQLNPINHFFFTRSLKIHFFLTFFIHIKIANKQKECETSAQNKWQADRAISTRTIDIYFENNEEKLCVLFIFSVLVKPSLSRISTN